MKYGMTDEQFDLLEKLVIRPLKNQGLKVFIFGSRTTLKYHSHSDVDLLFKAPSGYQLPAGFLSEIKENIAESRFPFSVDLVADNELASSYRESVEAGQVEL